ncbi:angio-associated migratory cell protein isoform X1 [Eupeodes corollae]|uniref:angio-associated migratory cell protein isoform X1 n=2 Tax=Eupeodes corollae TaxID=290404 RepID=UPI00248FFFA6|nr:angio-associated migratory cell protein isoform X1 [Eupeodes corollae]
MRENTPPRIQDIEDDEDVEEDYLIGDNEEFEEVTIEDLEAMVGGSHDHSDDDEDNNDAEPEPRTPVQDDAILTLRGHAGSAFTCSMHPTKDWAVTGGEDDKAIVWNTQTGEKIHTVEGHKDSVIETHFSSDGSYLATGDMAGEIMVFKISDDLTKIWDYSMGDMCWMKWHRAANVLIAGSEAGEIYIWRIPSGDCKILPGNGVKCESAEITGDGKKLLAGYGNGTVKLWDIKSNSIVMEVELNHPMAHKDNVSTVSCDKENPVYMTGGEDGKILFLTNSGPVGSVEAGGPVECVAFSPSADFKVAASGTLQGQIAIWDYQKYSMRTQCEHQQIDDGVTSMKWISDHTLLVGTIQGNIFGYDARNGSRIFTLSGHLGDIYAMQYNAREGIVMSVSEDQTAKIFKCPTLE